MSHTPGPWKVSNQALYAQWAVKGEWHGLPSSEDNLRLQAAAPDMLVALKAMRKAYAKCTFDNARQGALAEIADERADAAIAKATTGGI